MVSKVRSPVPATGPALDRWQAVAAALSEWRRRLSREINELYHDFIKRKMPGILREIGIPGDSDIDGWGTMKLFCHFGLKF